MSDSIRCPWQEWQLRECLGEGASGLVWRAVNGIGQECAIKQIPIPPEPDWIPALREQGLSDTQINSKLDELTSAWSGEAEKLLQLRGSAHIVRLEEYRILSRQDPPEREIWLRMERLKSLTNYLADKRLSEAEIIQMGLDLCDALSDCHRHGFVHGDIKPENILVDDRNPSGVVFKLGDFSIAREFQDVSSPLPSHGTPAYLPPEISDGGKPDPRSDQYSLGLTLYRLMNENRLPFLSRRPFASREEQAAALQIRLSGVPLPPPCQASAQLAAILLQACEYDPTRRFPSIRHMRASLLDLQRRQARSEGSRYRRILWPCAFLATTALILAGWLFLFRVSPALPSQPVEARQLTRSERLSALLRDLEGILFAEDRYIIPVHLLQLSSVNAILDDLPLPSWKGDALSAGSDDPGWDVWAQQEDGKIRSYVYSSEDGLYHPQGGTTPEAFEKFFLRTGEALPGQPTIEISYGFEMLFPQILTINFFESPRTVRLALTQNQDDDSTRWTLRYTIKKLPLLTACYDTDGKLLSISSGKHTFAAEDTLPVLPDVSYLP